MKKLNLKAVLLAALATLGLAGVAFLGFYFPLPMLFVMGIVLFASFAYNAYTLFSITFKDKNK